MLSIEQQAIVVHPVDRHAVVLAVAGSGKSTTMAERIAYLVEAKRVDPTHLIAVMFNKAASLELAAKLEGRLGKRNSPMSVTYHRLGTLTLKRLIKLGLAPDWEFEASPLRASYFATNVIEDACNRYGHKYPRLVADVFLSFIDRVKGDLVTPQEVWRDGDWDEKFKWFVDMYPVYERVREKKQKRFFSDLIYDPVTIMAKNDKASSAIANRYEHIIVDEYQDICESQQSLIRFVAGDKARVMVVGDDDQTIYTWRGAKPSYILRDFQRDFPGATVYQLTRTWRYGHALSCAANYVITGNTDRADKLCISGDHAPATDISIEWEGQGGSKLLEIISKWLSGGGKLADIAVLVRAYSKSAFSQFAMLKEGIPFRLEGGDDVSVLENKWVVCLLGWMNLAAGRLAERPYVGEADTGSVIALRKVLDMPPIGLSWEATNALCRSVLAKPDNMDGFADFVRVGLHTKDGSLSEKIYQRGKLWKKVRSLSSIPEIDPYDLLSQLLLALSVKKSIYKMASKVEDADDQWALVEAFLAYVEANAKGKTLKHFLDHVNDLRSFSERAKESTEAIHMTSIHRSKGLEWPCVVMIGLSQGGFPLKPKKVMDVDRMAIHFEDERRLFYVGMTRARKMLYLLSPEDALLHQWLRAGKSGSPSGMPMDGVSASQFLYESNLYLAKTMPAMVKRPLTLSAGDPEVYNSYLQALGKDARVGKIESGSNNRGDDE
ncbi:UvrD-helicase domain-containing protein [Stutzerimonas stutzeri]|uniref:UvrD-helicase domain-containing protein n=1 Tax=Stutzerimonas stutzeri TaxID=316 RepID=UPI0015E46552|nr:ATP-dependent helicase [Stutzerimonas stutzeri]